MARKHGTQSRNAGVRLWLLLMVVASLFPVAANAGNLLAPQPPDSVLLAGQPMRNLRIFQIFLSKRTPDELRAFYGASAGPFANGTGSSHGADGRVLMSYQQVLNVLLARHGDQTLADDLRVRIDWKPLPANHMACSGDFFTDLMAIARMQKRQGEFDSLCNQYGYLDNAFFQKVPDPRNANQWIDADKEILARAHQELQARPAASLGTDAQQIAQRIQQLTLSGRTEEAKALAAQLQHEVTQTTNSVTNWDAWVRVLKEGDAMGYRTWVSIPTNPSTW
jgi:hypothetical protein